MIIKGKSVAGASRLAAHLLRADHNERIEIKEMRGSTAADLRGALTDMEALAAGTACKRPLYHASINTRIEEKLSEEQRTAAIDRLEFALGLTGQPRVIVIHEKAGSGREHTHIVWSRVDLERNRIISDSYNFRKHEAVSRHLEHEFGHAPVRGVHVGRQGNGQKRKQRPERSPGHDEMQQATRSGTRPADATAQITALWRGTATGQEFAAALTKSGWTLCRGDRRDFVLMDSAGGVHSLARRVQGARAADIRARMKDVDPMTLPAVSEARSAIRASSPRTASGVVKLPREITRRSERAQPQAGDRRDDRSSGLFVTVSRKRLDYGRPLIQPGANSNSPISWTPARVAVVGTFRAAARLAVTPCETNAAVASFNRRPMRPETYTAEPVADGGGGSVDELGGLLEAIAAEVNARAGIVCDGIAADFAGRIRQARKMPKHLAAAEIAALRQAQKAAVKFVQESATMEITGRQKHTRIIYKSIARFLHQLLLINL